MFTGIVEEIGVVKAIAKGTHSIKLSIKAKKVLENTQLGDSIAVNGVCLTVTFLASDYFIADVMPESMRKTNMGLLKIGDKVNLERALTLSSRLGGHIVSGHIDTTGVIQKIAQDSRSIYFEIQIPADFAKYVATKGSITVDGISLTSNLVQGNIVSLNIIPHTAQVTNIGRHWKVGSKVNIEVDVVARYLERLLTSPQASHTTAHQTPGITLEFLAKNGFYS